jgi:hypothetical protein
LPHKPNFSLQVTQQLTGSVQFKLSSLWFSNFVLFLNSEPDLWFSSVKPSNFGLNFGPVWESSGSNFGSELNCGSPRVEVVVALDDVVWPDGSSLITVPNDLLSLVWTDLAHRCSSHRYSLSSARFKTATLPRQVHSFMRIVPKTLQRCSTEAELGQMERIWHANWASGVSGWFG